MSSLTLLKELPQLRGSSFRISQRNEGEIISSLNSDGFFHVPDERTESEKWFVEIEFMQIFEQRLNLLIVGERDHRRSERRPCVRTVMRFAGFRTASLNFTESGEATAHMFVEHFDDMLMVSQIVGYEYCFHIFSSLALMAIMALRCLRRLFLTPLPAKTQ